MTSMPVAGIRVGTSTSMLVAGIRAGTPAQPADLVPPNAKIFTGDPKRPRSPCATVR
ncbi:hypothetical protein AB0945_07555 [Streptomyces sp. NPDC005474]|uniref:hypothetical protein n=1 Tax=Streptomyces sp. NPDC005474 TaxID=3154878 RepID=UPI003454953B